MNKYIFLALIVVFISLVKGDFVSVTRTKDYKNAPNILTLKLKGISCDEFMKQGISRRIRGGVAGDCLPISADGKATDEIRFSGRCFNVHHNAIVEILELKTKPNLKRSARDIEGVSQIEERKVSPQEVANYNPYPKAEKASLATLENDTPIKNQFVEKQEKVNVEEKDESSFTLKYNDELLDPETPFYIRLRSVSKKRVQFRVISHLAERKGAKVHSAQVPTCFKTTDFCEESNKYVNFCKRNTHESIKKGELTKDDGAVYLLVNTHSSAPDTCKDAQHKCCAYVNGANGVCRTSNFFEEDGHRGNDNHGPNGFHKKKEEEEEPETEQEEKMVDFGKQVSEKQEKQEKKEEIETETEEKRDLPKARIGKSIIVKREEESDEEEKNESPVAAKKSESDDEEEEDEKKKKSVEEKEKKNDEEEEDDEEDDKKRKRNIIPISKKVAPKMMKLNTPAKK